MKFTQQLSIDGRTYLSRICSVRIEHPNGKESYLSDEGEIEWPKAKAIRQMNEAANLEHFAGCRFHLEEN